MTTSDARDLRREREKARRKARMEADEATARANPFRQAIDGLFARYVAAHGEPAWQWPDEVKAQHAEEVRRLDEMMNGALRRSLEGASVDLSPLGALPTSFTAADVTRAFRRQALRAHPDRGGTHEQMVKLNAARDAAMGMVAR